MVRLADTVRDERLEHLQRSARCGGVPEQILEAGLTEHASRLGAAVGFVPLRERPVAHLLDPDRPGERGERGRRRVRHVGRLAGHLAMPVPMLSGIHGLTRLLARSQAPG